METGNLNALDKHRILPERPTLMRLFGKTLFKNNTFQLGHVLPELSNEMVVGNNKVRITKDKLTKKQKKKKETETKKTIPKEFIAHIVKLGFDAKDAERLYESKDDWLGMAEGGNVLCV